MRYKDLSPKSLSHFQNRVAKVEENTERRWGVMTPAQMLVHVNLLIKTSLGELPIEGNGQVPFRWLKLIVLSGVFPFPRNKLKAPPILLTDEPGNVSKAREDLEGSITRFLGLCHSEPDRVQTNPVFGPLSMTQWTRLHGLHLNHHLDQFGI